MSELSNKVEAALIEAVNIKRWEGEELNSVLTKIEAKNVVENIAIRLDNAGYEIKKK